MSSSVAAPSETHAKYASTVEAATSELRCHLLNVNDSAVDDLLDILSTAQRVACFGVGREGLAM